MKKMYLFIFVILVSLSVSAQNWEWLQGFNTVDYSETVIDNAGNSYTLIQFKDSINELSYQNSWQEDSLHTKIIMRNTNNLLLWEKEIYCTGLSYFKICLKNNSEPYLTGSFSGTFTSPDLTMISNGYLDIFLVQISSTGGFSLVKHLGGAGDERGECAFDSRGYLIVTGGYTYSGTFDTLFFSGKATQDFFLLAYNSALQLQWAERAISPDTMPTYYCSGSDILTDSLNNIYVRISGDGLLQNNGVEVGEFYGANLYKFNSEGEFKQEFDIHQSYVSSDCIGLDIDNNGNIYCFYVITPTHSSGTYHAVKYDSLGNTVWQKHYGYNGIVGPLLDDRGNYYFSASVDPDSVCMKPVIIKADAASGNLVWKFCEGLCFTPNAIDLNQNIYFTGRFKDSLTLGFNTIVSSFEERFEPVLAKFSLGTIGFAELPSSVFLPVFPNPSTGQFVITFDQPSNTNICVYDLLGNCIYTKAVNNTQEHKIDLSDKAKGIYFLKMFNESESFTQKIILN